jgi:hypothetical protein
MATAKVNLKAFFLNFSGLVDNECSGKCLPGHYCPEGSVSPTEMMCPKGKYVWTGLFCFLYRSVWRFQRSFR